MSLLCPSEPQKAAFNPSGQTKNSLNGKKRVGDTFSGQWELSIWLTLSFLDVHNEPNCLDLAIWGKALEDASLLINCW